MSGVSNCRLVSLFIISSFEVSLLQFKLKSKSHGVYGMVVLVVQFGQFIPHLKALGLLILTISVLDQFIYFI